MSNPNKIKIFFWSPMLSKVGTVSAIIGMANSIKKFSSLEIYILDILGEFSDYKNQNFYFLKFSNINKIIPNKGKISKLLIIFFSLISLPFLIYNVKKHKPDYIITGLVGFIPGILKYFFKNLKIINSIQGYPNINYYRKLIWSLFYKKSDFLITMTEQTKKDLQNKIKINSNKIFVINNPILTRNIIQKSKEEIEPSLRFIFQKKVFCAIGRLTRQKNFIQLFEYLNYYKNQTDDEFNLIVLGDGEKKGELIEYIKTNKINNFYLLGYQNNPFKFLSKSKLYICSSLWEDPGHTLIEAGYLNIPILTSNCPNGPNEIIQNDYNGMKYELGNKEDFFNKLKKINSYEASEKKKLLINMKKIAVNYSQLRFAKKFLKLIN